MIIFAQETYTQVADDMKEILERHAATMAEEGGFPFEPNWPVYQTADIKGILRVYTLREHGKLYGYQVFFVGTNLHHAGTKSATSDVCWIEPEMRRFGAGMRLLRYAEDCLRHEGILWVQQMTKDSHPAMGRLLEAINYVKLGSIYSKRLGHA